MYILCIYISQAMRESGEALHGVQTVSKAADALAAATKDLVLAITAFRAHSRFNDFIHFDYHYLYICNMYVVIYVEL